MMVMRSCENIDGGLPASLRMKMTMNIIFDFVIGLVPFVGDLADAMYKCNTRNAVILEKYLREKGSRAIAKRRKQNEDPDVDYSLPDEFDRYDEADGRPSRHASRSRGKKTKGPTRPQPARHAQSNRQERRFFGGSAPPDADLETGVVDNSRR